MDAPSDPDLQHLANLLGFLPGPDDSRFWTLVDERGTQRTRRYVLDKMSWHLLTLRTADPPPHKVVALVECLMMFFGGGNPALHELLDECLAPVPLPAGVLGRYWAEDLMATCWRLWERHSADGSWAEKWPSEG